jgi:hypothetical protein
MFEMLSDSRSFDDMFATNERPRQNVIRDRVRGHAASLIRVPPTTQRGPRSTLAPAITATAHLEAEVPRVKAHAMIAPETFTVRLRTASGNRVILVDAPVNTHVRAADVELPSRRDGVRACRQRVGDCTTPGCRGASRQRQRAGI